nr:hypothetical protein [Tanacetum cinerariifolium]
KIQGRINQKNLLLATWPELLYQSRHRLEKGKGFSALLGLSWRSDAQKADHIAESKTYLDDIYALIDGYNHSLAENDVEIIWLKDSPSSLLLSLEVVFRAWALGRLVKATPLVATTDYPFLKKFFNHAAHPLFAVINLEPEKLAHPEVVPASKITHVSPSLAKKSIVTLVSSSLEFPSNDVPSSTAALWNRCICSDTQCSRLVQFTCVTSALLKSEANIEQPSSKQNEEWVRVMVDILDEEIVDVALDKPVVVFVQEMSIYDFMTLLAWGDAKDELIVAQPDLVLAKKSKALTKRKASTSLAPSRPDHLDKKNNSGRKARRLGLVLRCWTKLKMWRTPTFHNFVLILKISLRGMRVLLY